jgi:uncharacterized protein DUF6011
MPTMLGRAPSPRQISYIESLLEQRDLPEPLAVRLRERIAGNELDMQACSDAIEYLRNCAFKATPERTGTQVTEPGLYEHGDLVYKVQYNKSKTNLYAMVLDTTMTEARRLTEAGTTIKATYTYDKGAIFKISAEHRITGERASELSFVFSNCLVCGRKLTDAQSVARSIGPVCINKV